MAYSANAVFNGWGKILKSHRWLTDILDRTLGTQTTDDFFDLSDVLRSEAKSTLTANDIERDIEGELSSILTGLRDTLLGEAEAIKAVSDLWITDRIRDLLISTELDPATILDDLNVAMNAVSDTVEGNAVGSGPVDSAGITNSNAGTLTIDATTGFARPQSNVQYRCIDTSVQGSELWEASHSRVAVGVAPSQATTGVAFEFELAGLDVTINAGTTIVESGDTYDGGGQLSNWILTGFTEANTDAGKLYAVVKKNPGGYTSRTYVSLYNDQDNMAFPASSALVCQGFSEGPFPDVITLEEKNSSGISGSVRISKHPTSDRTVTLTLPVYLIGDRFIVPTTSDDEGLIFSVVRDLHDHLLPASAAGYTIPDSKIL